MPSSTKRASELATKAVILPDGVMPDNYRRFTKELEARFLSWLKTGVLYQPLHYDCNHNLANGPKGWKEAHYAPTDHISGMVYVLARDAAADMRRPFVFAQASQVGHYDGQGAYDRFDTQINLVLPRNARCEVLWAPLLVVAQDINAPVVEGNFNKPDQNRRLRSFIFHDMAQWENWYRYASENPKCQWALGVRADYPRG